MTSPVMDYISRDAHGIKFLQKATARFPYLKFVFLVDEDVGPEHLVMAMNAGAVALLSTPVKTGIPEKLCPSGRNRRQGGSGPAKGNRSVPGIHRA